MSKPISEINILNVPFNSTNQNVFTFDSLAQQTNYFRGKILKSYPLNTIVKNDSVKVSERFENVIGNYIMYKNDSKYYYGFITDVIYINDNTTEIFYDIDAWQTYYFDIDIKKSFVEREHVTNDAIGSNLISEPFNYPKYPLSTGLAFENYQNHYLAVTFTGDAISETPTQSELDDIRAGIVTRVVGHNKGRATGGITKIYTINNMGLNALLRDVNKLEDKGANTITSMVEVPSSYITEVYNENLNSGGVDGVDINTLATVGYTYKADTLATLQSKLGYTVVNKKLLSDQFFHWEVVNNGGGSLETYPSEVNYDAPDYHSVVNGGQNIYGVLRVDNLKVGRETVHLTSAPFDTVSWNGSSYAEYLSQNQNSINMNAAKNALNTASGVVGGIASAAITGNVGGVVSAFVGGIVNVMDTQAKERDIQNTSVGLRGTQTSSGVGTILANKFVWWSYTLNKNDLQRADEFLSRYGYQVNNFKIPNLKTRTGFNYIKTGECNITGAIPSKYMLQIITMFNSGFTLWHNQNQVMARKAQLPNQIVVESEVNFNHFMDHTVPNEIRSEYLESGDTDE